MTDKPIHLFNTRSKYKELFSPLEDGKVTMYHCGPTVYRYQHIGNMRRFIFADLVHRMFKQNGYEVKQIINITDVGHLVGDVEDGEDKMEKSVLEEGKSAQKIADFYKADFMNDLGLLHILVMDTSFPKATEHIPEQIELIKKLEQKGFTYVIDDGVYFDTAKDARYADFAHLNLEGMTGSGRVLKNDQKKNPADFALWKLSPKNEKREQEWEAPWGVGFPGWHLECSAMIQKFLGTTIDVHTGGVDHITVHHTNEIAQSECANEQLLAHYWMHNEHLNFNNAKMAKSGESFIRLKDVIEKKYHPLAFRYFTELAHYRTKINFTFEALTAAQTAWTRLHEFIFNIKSEGTPVTDYIFKAKEAFNDDLDTPTVIALMWELIKDEMISESDKKSTLLAIGNMIGIIDRDFISSRLPEFEQLPKEIQMLINERNEARKEKNWKKSDEIREILTNKGYKIED